MIDLEDFSSFLEVEKKREESGGEKRERSVEEVEAVYREELLRLQARFKAEVERVREEAYREGFQAGVEKTREELEEKLKTSVEQLRKEYEEKLSRLEQNLDSLLKQLDEAGQEVVRNFLKTVSDSLVEILEFLYISPENASFVKKSLEELLSTFTSEELISVEVGRELGKVLKGSNVKVNEELGENDFRLIFKEFTLETKLKEKLKLLREELEREIKKLT